MIRILRRVFARRTSLLIGVLTVVLCDAMRAQVIPGCGPGEIWYQGASVNSISFMFRGGLAGQVSTVVPQEVLRCTGNPSLGWELSQIEDEAGTSPRFPIGAMVVDYVVPGSPAAGAGIQYGDVVLSMPQFEIGKPVSLRMNRDGRDFTVNTTPVAETEVIKFLLSEQFGPIDTCREFAFRLSASDIVSLADHVGGILDAPLSVGGVSCGKLLSTTSSSTEFAHTEEIKKLILETASRNWKSGYFFLVDFSAQQAFQYEIDGQRVDHRWYALTLNTPSEIKIVARKRNGEAYSIVISLILSNHDQGRLTQNRQAPNATYQDDYLHQGLVGVKRGFFGQLQTLAIGRSVGALEDNGGAQPMSSEGAISVLDGTTQPQQIGIQQEIEMGTFAKFFSEHFVSVHTDRIVAAKVIVKRIS